MIVDIYIEGERLDLYDNENITVNSKLNDINDISKLFTDFSQSFTVPASRRNNNIFKQYYNSDILNGYDARIRKTANIDVNTLNFKRGKIRLDNVKLEQGVPLYYKITFFGNGINLKDEIGDDKLKDLTWLSNFDHDYDETQVKTGLTTGLDFTVDSTLYEKAVIYPLISYNRQYLYNSDPTDVTSTDTLVNIAYDSGRSDGVLFSELKPAIKLELIIKAIEEQYSVNFTGGFFNSQNFKEIYMNLNNSTESLASGLVEVESETGTYSVSPFIASYSCTVTPDAGYTTTPYKIRLTHNDIVVYESSNWLVGTQSKGAFFTPNGVDYTTKAEIITESDFVCSADTTHKINLTTLVYTNSYTGVTIDLRGIITSLVPDLKVYEFLESLFETFNLVITPDGDDILINDLQTWYSEGQIYDITQFVDTSSETVKRGKIYKSIDFKFEESDQILADEFRKSNSIGYGDLEFELTDANGNPLADVDGEDLDIEVLFENPIYERLFDLNDNSETTVFYCPYFSRDIKSLVGSPFLFYAPDSTVSGNPIGFKGISSYTEINGDIFKPSHSREIQDFSFNLNFNAEINEYTSQLFQDTIFNAYYKDYITDMFSVKRRMYDFKAELPDYLLSKLKLNDRLIIKNKRYILNNISSNIVDRGDTLELINDIYDAPLASDTLNTSTFRTSQGVYSNNAQRQTAEYIGLANQTIDLIDTGDGFGWLTVGSLKTTSTVDTIEFDLDLNLGGIRSAQIEVQDGLNNPRFTVIQNEFNGSVFDFSNPNNAAINSLILTTKQ